jgi:hypothetical protein
MLEGGKIVILSLEIIATNLNYFSYLVIMIVQVPRYHQIAEKVTTMFNKDAVITFNICEISSSHSSPDDGGSTHL